MIFTKDNITVTIRGKLSEEWLTKHVDTSIQKNLIYKIISKFSDGNKIYIDIGSWYGFTALYAEQLYKTVYCLEPDPVSAEELLINTKNYKKIKVIQKGISDKEGKYNIDEKKIGTRCSRLVNNNSSKREVITITFEQFINRNKIKLDNIGLIKMDIEGHETIVIVSMIPILKKYKPNIVIDVHWSLLTIKKIEKMLDELYSIYKYCYSYYMSKPIKKKFILDKKVPCIIFVDRIL